MENDMGVSESFALTDQLGEGNVNTYHSNVKDLLPGLRNLKKPEILRSSTLDKPFTEYPEWTEGIWTYTFSTTGEKVTFRVEINDISITDGEYIVPYGKITDSTGKEAIVTSMNEMFKNCHKLTSLDLSDWDTSKVTGMGHMFYECDSLTTLDLSGWGVSNVHTFFGIFYGCNSLRSLDLSGWDTSNVTGMSYMFDGCIKLSTITISQTGTKILEQLPYGAWIFKYNGTDRPLQNAIDSSNWLSDFGSTTLTFTRTV
jgi:surface protein